MTLIVYTYVYIWVAPPRVMWKDDDYYEELLEKYLEPILVRVRHSFEHAIQNLVEDGYLGR